MAYNANMNVADIRAGLLAGDFTAREVAEASFKRIEELDGEVHAFLELTKDAAFEQAAKIDEALANGTFDEMGPLAGVPVAFKDNMNYEGTYTTCSSLMLENYVSPYTATCVAKTIEAGGIPLGKLNMDEFAFGSSTETSAFGPTKTRGILSASQAAAPAAPAASVAAGLACVTLGSDTGGSIRQPAAFCGIVGVKPTYGMVSRYGVVAFGSSLDQVGPFARSVRDAAAAMDAICGHDSMDCTSQYVKPISAPRASRGVEGMRIGVVSGFMNAPGLTDEVKARVSEATEHLRQAGAEIVEVELPNADAAISAYYVLGPCEAFSNLARFDSVRYGYCEPGHKDLGSQYEASVLRASAPRRRRIMLGSYPAFEWRIREVLLSGSAGAHAHHAGLRGCIRKWTSFIAPTSPRTAFKFGEIADPTSMYLSDIFTVSINIAGNGGMNVPCGLGSDSGMPVGVQLISPAFKDENMLRAAAALEAVYGAAHRPDFAAPTFADGKDGE